MNRPKIYEKEAGVGPFLKQFFSLLYFVFEEREETRKIRFLRVEDHLNSPFTMEGL